MIMNKKIFTLLAGILMLGLFAVSGNAQGRSTFLKKQDLRVGKPVRKLQAGPNKGYYYLSVDSVVGFNSATALGKLKNGRGDTIQSYIPDGNNGSKKLMVLFMRPDTNKNGKYSLFVDTLNVIKRTGNRDSVKAKWKGYFKDNTPKTEISASALWCVNVTDYQQGQNPTFDFTNKQYETLLEIDAYNHESWRYDSTMAFNTVDRKNWRMSPAHGDTSLVPGGLSGWEFSETYATVLNAGRPLVTYLDDTHDTVAVLCMPRDTSGGHRFGELVPDSFICVKIAPATDVRAGKVDGMLYFTLREALPFALDANDFNSLSRTNPLKFSPDAASNNIFTSGLEAAQLDTSAHRAALVNAAFLKSYATPPSPALAPWNAPVPGDTVLVAFPDSILDYLGYLHLKSGNNYLRVDSNFHVRNAGGDQFLKFATGTQAQMWTKLRGDTVSLRDSLMYGQYVWRMVYYPSGDSVYINPFKAAYRPEYDPAIWRNGADSVRTLGWVTQQRYTFAAIPDTAVLYMQSNSSVNDGHLDATNLALISANTNTMVTTVNKLDSNQVKTARLRDGFMIGAENTRGEAAPLPYKYRHRLYVSIQNLASGREVTLHSNHSGFLPAGDCSINTHINFGGYYTPCLATGSDRVSIPSDLYLIRNTDGQYLHVPLYSAHDSAVWTYLDEFVHPEELPSFQWIVEKRYRNSENSPINIINREFGHRVGNKYGLAFENVQLKKDMKHFSFRTDRWRWNEEKMVNERTTTFDAAKSNMSEKNGATFIALPKKYKNDPLLGYQWINPDTSIVNLYAFNYASGIDDSRYISTAKDFDMNAYPRTDTFLYIGAKDNFDVAYFRMDTIGAENGKLNEYGYKVVSNKNQVDDLVTLKRQAYRLNFENPFKYCLGTLSVSNAAQHFYSLSSRLTAPLTNILGRPVFYLRDVYMENDGVKDFALVQVMDTVAMQSADSTQLKTYMTQTLGSQVSDLMMRNLRIAGKFNPGLFVMAVDEPTLKLKFDYRGNSVTRVSTFRLKKDADPIYRRFNTELEGKVGDDSPRTMKFFRTSSMTTGKDYLFENTGALTDQKAYYKGPRNYLGLVSSNSNPNAKTSIFVDTAYVNRGTGYIKPQYLLMIRPSIVNDTLGCDDNGELTIHLPGYRRGMYLINATDSANMERTAGVDDERNTYLWNTRWERFVFTDAIHANDALYILGGADLSNLYTKVDAKGNVKALDLAKLDAVSDPTPAAPKNGKIRKIALGNNYHKDCVFSFRLVERGSPQKDFLIESETAYRGEPITDRNPMIAPCIGGWLKIQNGVPVISRSDEENRIPEGDLFNVEMTSEDPVSNVVVPATTGVKVVAENGSVTVLNASGKRVVISNVLGQTVANTVLTSDRATVSAPKGVVLVAVEGEPVVKALVK
jgi:surface layer protein B (fragment)